MEKDKLSIFGTFRELQEVQKNFRDSLTLQIQRVNYYNLTLNQRINYKGWNELKARNYGTLTNLGQRELYFRMYELKVPFAFCMRYYRFFAEASRYTNN